MKILNKFWLVALVSAGLYSCGDTGVKPELAACQAKVDSLESLRQEIISALDVLTGGI
jgi:hypothetical protein